MQREKVIGVDGENIFCGWIWSSSKNRWVNGGSSYAKEDGTLAENEWLEIDGKNIILKELIRIQVWFIRKAKQLIYLVQMEYI